MGRLELVNTGKRTEGGIFLLNFTLVRMNATTEWLDVNLDLDFSEGRYLHHFLLGMFSMKVISQPHFSCSVGGMVSIKFKSMVLDSTIRKLEPLANHSLNNLDKKSLVQA